MEVINREKKYDLLILIFVLLIFGTRFIGLTYNMQIHPDENKFFYTTTSLLESLLDSSVEFKEAKEYPEGSYYFQLPFQALGYAVGAITGKTQDPQVWGRVSSVFYFTAAAWIGMVIQRKWLGKSIASIVLYGLTMCFSLFFIEHSRYGVGDMISLFLLMLIVYLTCRGAEAENGSRYLLLSFAAAGVMGAVKYPQVFFGLIPLSALWFREQEDRKRFRKHLILGGIVAFAAFLLFSPKGMLDWKYFYRVIRRESDAYLISGTTFESGGFLNHAVTMVLYNLLYSDYPLAYLFLGACFLGGIRRNGWLLRARPQTPEARMRFLLHWAVPVVAVLFLLYNLLPSLLVFRTYTPFFGLSALYASFAAAKFAEKGRWRSAAVGLLTLLLVIRGSALMAVTASGDSIQDQFGEKVYGAVDENWNRTVCLDQYIIPFDRLDLESPEQLNLSQWKEANGGSLEIAPGTLVITGAYPFALAHPYVLPLETKDSEFIALWQEFLDVNESYFVDRAYPDSYYYLFGGWLRGGTLSTSLIPCNYIFYRP